MDPARARGAWARTGRRGAAQADRVFGDRLVVSLRSATLSVVNYGELHWVRPRTSTCHRAKPPQTPTPSPLRPHHAGRCGAAPQDVILRAQVRACGTCSP